MHTDKHPESHDPNEVADSGDDSPERSLSWLLDMDLSDPEERLFEVEQASQVDTGLTDYELDVASRPMTRGAEGADDLATYVQEEIVMCSDSQSSDIYADETAAPLAQDVVAASAPGEPMAIDYSRGFEVGAVELENEITDGDDILGLADDDDMGEAYLVIKRVKAGQEAAQQGPEDLSGSSADAGGAAQADSQAENTSLTEEADEERWLSTPAPESKEADELEAPVDSTTLSEDVAAAGDTLEVLPAPPAGEPEAEAEAIALLDAGELEFEAVAVSAAEDDGGDDWLSTPAAGSFELEELEASAEPMTPVEAAAADGDPVDELPGLPAAGELETENEAISLLDEGELEFEAGAVSAGEEDGGDDWLSTPATGSFELEELEASAEPMTPVEAAAADGDPADEPEAPADSMTSVEDDMAAGEVADATTASPEDGEAEIAAEAEFDTEDVALEDLLAASTSVSIDPDEPESETGETATAMDSGSEETVSSPQKNNEAPLLRLVPPTEKAQIAADDTPAALTDVPLDEDETGSAAESLGAGDDDLLGYIAAVPPPVDEHEFDAYLLRGRQLRNHEMGLEDLTLGPVEGQEGYDVERGNAIDYHEDFQQFTGFPGDAVASVTPMVRELMEELSLFINGRLATLGLPAASVEAELKLAGGADSAEQLLAEGFEPAIAVCPLPLAALQQMRQAEVDVIFLRLVQCDTGQLCNRLFDTDFAPSQGDHEEVDTATTKEQDDVPSASESPESATPEENLFAADTLDAIAETTLQSDDADIDDILTGLGEPDSESVADLALAETAGDVGSDIEQADSFNVFGDDPLGDETDFEGEAGVATSEADIDALFESLDPGAGDADEFAGLDFHGADGGTGRHLQPVEQTESATPAGSESGSGTAVALIPAGIKFSQASPGGGEIFADFLEAFLEEGSSELEKLEDAVARWEKEVESESAFANVSRILHTLKGIAKGVGLQFYSTLVHNFETLLGAMPRPEAGAEGDYFRVVNTWLDACVRGLDHIQDEREDITCELPQVPGQDAPKVEAAGLSPEDDSLAVREQTPEAPLQPVPTELEAAAKKLSNKIADDGAKVLAAQQSVRITSEKLDHLLNLSNQAQQLSVRTAQSVTRGKRASTEMQSRLASVRSHIAAIADRALRSVAAKGVQPGAPMDALEMDQYSELQEAANILGEGVEDLADLVDFATRQNTQVEALLKQQTKVISSIGTSIRGARVVPVSRLIPGLRRLVRTVSVELDKTVSFKVLNELGTLDRDDYARCQTILDHMVRNALDHGIEPADERRAAGKPSDGQVTIDIRKAGADAIITLADDGRGVDPQKMRESAIRKGLDVDVDALSDAEAARLIFHKGFSTADSVSQISGRGVGMDIVLNELQEMGGDIQIDSIPGRGTSFHIRVPSSVTVNGALLVSAGKQSYAIPLGGLISVEQVPVEEFFAAIHDNSRLTFGGLECEPAYLATLCQSGDSLDAKTWQHHVPVIIAGSPDRYMAIAIDDVEEALELVIRSLGTQFSSVPGVAGAATTAAGEAIVALDLNLLVASVGSGDQSSLHVDTPRDEGLLVMVVDDSRTQRKVATSQLETVGVETITAENGAVAIDILNTADRLPDIILMDVEMPVKDGIQALREMRTSVRYGHVPVIMITSRTGLKHRAMAQAAGCNGYMGKPFNFRMLIGQINHLTGQRLQLS